MSTPRHSRRRPASDSTRQRFDPLNRDGPVAASELLRRLLSTLEKPSPDIIISVFKRWEQVVGADIARHCRPVAIEGDRLIVAADDPMWASEFQWLSEMVLERLAEVSGGCRMEHLAVRVVPGHLNPRRSEEQ